MNTYSISSSFSSFQSFTSVSYSGNLRESAENEIGHEEKNHKGRVAERARPSNEVLLKNDGHEKRQHFKEKEVEHEENRHPRRHRLRERSNQAADGISKGGDKVNNRHARNKELVSAEKNNSPRRLSEDSYRPSQAAKQRDVENASSRMALQSLVTNESQSMDIQVKTKEGDIVTINFNRLASSSQSAFQAEQGNNQISIFQQSASSESGFSFTVDGDLNDDEIQALTDLFDKMSEVSHDFFDGNVNAAFEHAQKLGIDTEQLAAFSMDLNMKKSVEAIAAYQQVAVPEQTSNTGLIGQARDFLAQTQDFLADSTSALDSLAEPKQSFADLFEGVSQMQQQARADKEPSTGEALFSKVIDTISNELFADKLALLDS